MNEFSLLVKWLADNESALSALAAIAVIGGILYGALRYVLTPILQRRHALKQDQKQSLAKAELKAQVATDRRYSLAVMLFDTLSTNADDEYLASGVTSEIIAQVTAVPTIRVSSRLSSFRFKTGDADINDVADQLNARFVLSGSLQHADDRIQVIAQLTDTETNSEIWARTYKRDIEDVFEVQRDIAECIVGTVLGEVKHAQSILARSMPEHQLDAWGLVQKAYHFWFNAFSRQGVLDACDYLRQAIKLDPTYANAKATLAMLLSQQMIANICDDYDACSDEASELIGEAYKQSPSDVDVLENAGIAWLHLGQARRATLALRSAVKITPLNLVARGYLALALSATAGRQGAKEAIEIVEQNFIIAPKHPSSAYWNYFRSMAEQRLGNHENSIEFAQLSINEQPEWVHSIIVMANAYAMLGKREQAKQSIELVNKINPFLSMQHYAMQITKSIGEDDQEGIDAFIGGLEKVGLLTK